METAELHCFIGRAIQLGADPARRDKLRELVQTIADQREAEVVEAIARWLESEGVFLKNGLRRGDWRKHLEPTDTGGESDG